MHPLLQWLTGGSMNFFVQTLIFIVFLLYFFFLFKIRFIRGIAFMNIFKRSQCSQFCLRVPGLRRSRSRHRQRLLLFTSSAPC